MLYLFLWQLIAVIWRDLRRPAEGEVGAVSAACRLVVAAEGGTSYQPGYSFPVRGRATIGRGPENSIVLGDGFVSTDHAVLSFRDGGWWLEDLSSRNGTWVNGERIAGEVRVRPGDSVTIGQVKLGVRG